MLPQESLETPDPKASHGSACWRRCIGIYGTVAARQTSGRQSPEPLGAALWCFKARKHGARRGQKGGRTLHSARAPSELSAVGFGQVVDRFPRARPVAADWGIAFAGKVVMPRVVGSRHKARVRVDENRLCVFACRR